jgi:hypothetical protein
MAKSIDQGMAKSIDQDMAKSIDQGMAKSIDQGMAKSIDQDMAKGIDQGMGEDRGKSMGADRSEDRGEDRDKSMGADRSEDRGEGKGEDMGDWYSKGDQNVSVDMDEIDDDFIPSIFRKDNFDNEENIMIGGGYSNSNYFNYKNLGKNNLINQSMLDKFNKRLIKKNENKIIYESNIKGYNRSNNYFELN